jgi:hypothetical protein
MSQLIAFPVQTECPTCHSVCSPEELSECLDCGDKYCGRVSFGCSSECDCDGRHQKEDREFIRRIMIRLLRSAPLVDWLLVRLSLA